MKRWLTYAIPHTQEGYCTNARSPYTWETVGRVLVTDDMTEADIEQACADAGIPQEAYCVAAEMAEV